MSQEALAQQRNNQHGTGSATRAPTATTHPGRAGQPRDSGVCQGRSLMPARHCGCARSASEGQAKVRPAFPPGKLQHQPCHGAGTAISSLPVYVEPAPGSFSGDIPPEALPAHLPLPVVGKSLPGHSRSLTNLQQYLDIWDLWRFSQQSSSQLAHLCQECSPHDPVSCCHKQARPVWMLRGH